MCGCQLQAVHSGCESRDGGNALYSGERARGTGNDARDAEDVRVVTIAIWRWKWMVSFEKLYDCFSFWVLNPLMGEL